MISLPTYTKEQRAAHDRGTKSLWKKTYYPLGRSSLSHTPFYQNDNRAMIPQYWSQEAVTLLYEQMVYGGIVHRSHSQEIANFGDTVHVHKVGTFKARRKQNDLDPIQEQPATTVDLEVKLNLRVQVSFILGDRERSLSFKELVPLFLEPAIMANAQHLDRSIASKVYQFRHNAVGGYGTLQGSTAHQRLLDVRHMFNNNKVSDAGRWLGLASDSETTMQSADLFKSAERVGDGGLALQNALLGRKAGINSFLSLNTPGVPKLGSIWGGSPTTTAAAVEAGATTFTVDSAAGYATGDFIVVTGENLPHRITNIATTTFTVDHPFKFGAASGATVQRVANAAVDQGSAISAGDSTVSVADGYPAGWLKEINVDTVVPYVGQQVAFKAAGGTVHPTRYGIIEVDDLGSGNYAITLDQPLVDTIADDDIVNLGPPGDHNFALTREAVALVNRPLRLPMVPNVLAGVGMFENMSLRTVISYDPNREGTIVTIGGLFGCRTLDTVRGGMLVA